MPIIKVYANATFTSTSDLLSGDIRGPLKEAASAAKSLFSGDWHNVAAGSQTSFRTYKLELQLTHHYFTDADLKGWAREYEIAKFVFGSGMASAAARASSRSLGALLFHHRPMSRSAVGDRTNVRTAADLLQVMQPSLEQGAVAAGGSGRPVFFDYVLRRDGQFRFAPVDLHNYMKKSGGKHLVICETDEEVFYAGDMFVLDGTLHLTNASGTYRPPYSNMPKLVALLQAEIPGLPIVTHDAGSPRFKEKMRTYLGPDYE